MHRLPVLVALLFTMFWGAAAPAGAADRFAEKTLDRIRATGVMRVGYGQTPPFSYLDDTGAVVGYSIDLCRRLAEHLRVQLGLPAIALEFVPRTPSDRVLLLNSGAIDIECNASTNSEERRQSVAFAVPHFYAVGHYVALAKNELNTIDDLRGRSVGVVFGTVNVGHVTRLNRERRLNLSLVPVETLAMAFEMVTRERVAAFAMDDALLRALVLGSRQPSLYRMSQEPMTAPTPYGFMMRLGDKEFEEAVNSGLCSIYASPDMVFLYDRWFNEPIPRYNAALNVPMSLPLAKTISAAGVSACR